MEGGGGQSGGSSACLSNIRHCIPGSPIPIHLQRILGQGTQSHLRDVVDRVNPLSNDWDAKEKVDMLAPEHLGASYACL